MKLVINAAMVPHPGTFIYRHVSAGEAASWLREHGDEAVSYVGYPQTADHIESLSGGWEVVANCCGPTRQVGWVADHNEALALQEREVQRQVNEALAFPERGKVNHDEAASLCPECGRMMVVSVAWRMVTVALNRAKCSMAPGDEALVVKLTYRVQDPATKGQPQPEDWEYGILQRIA